MKPEDYSFEESIKVLAMLRGVVCRKLEDALEIKLITQKEMEIMKYRHIEWNSLENCGQEFGVTRERIRQIEAKVLEKFRKFDETHPF